MVARNGPGGNARPAYRPDIDGLRAIAVGMVLIYHAFPSWLPGGWLGVDVFFVISGYLITQLVVNELAANTFSPRMFYARRVRRIVPALLLILLVSAAFGWYCMTPGELAELGATIRWSAPFLANTYFGQSGGYFAANSDLSPLLHLWSLGVEEQFYIVWPILLLAAYRQGVVVPVLRAVLAVSLLISLFGAWDSPGEHFFRATCRGWELAAGGLLAQYPMARYRRFASTLALTGLLLIAGSACWLDAERAFPGGWAIIPVVGASLIIGAGPQAWSNSRILSSGPFVFVGLISYSLYLWHWPLLSFARVLLGHPPAPDVAAEALVAAGMLACVTYYLVEQPIRDRSAAGRVPVALLAGLAAAGLLGVALDSHWIKARLRGPAFQQMDAATQDWKYPGKSKFRGPVRYATWEVPSRHARKVLFIGDSHLSQYWPRISYLIETRPDASQSAELAIYDGCPPLPGVNVRIRGVSCDRFFDFAIERARSRDVTTVVFGAYWESYLLGRFGAAHAVRHIYSVSDPLRRDLQLDSPAMQSVFSEFSRQVAGLVASGRRVIIVLSNQTSPRFEPLTLIPLRARLSVPAPVSFEPEYRTVDRQPYRKFAAPVVSQLRAIAEAAGAQVIDPADTLCDARDCAATAAGGAPLYLDSNHLRPSFARSGATFVDDMLIPPS
jgi:peptidoglycan/LPS O-acetylase OafA/YrhL